MKKTLIALLLAAASVANAGTVLVVLSDADHLDLKEGKILSTGFFLNELMQPVQVFLKQGHTVVFATPKGMAPTMDRKSNSLDFFGNDEQVRNESLALLNTLKLTSKESTPVISLERVAKIGYNKFDALYIPGGHAPMQDLLKDKALGKLLSHFHETGKPTGMTCHGTVALLAALPDAQGYVKMLEKGEKAVPARPWIYKGYQMTVISNAEETQAQDFLEGGKMKLLPQDGLEMAGGKVVSGAPWSSHVVEDRELVSGQNPQSALALAYLLAKKMK